jgi:hypothetical protein
MVRLIWQFVMALAKRGQHLNLILQLLVAL